MKVARKNLQVRVRIVAYFYFIYTYISVITVFATDVASKWKNVEMEIDLTTQRRKKACVSEVIENEDENTVAPTDGTGVGLPAA